MNINPPGEKVKEARGQRVQDVRSTTMVAPQLGPS